jgi:hypothetical protein
MGLTDGVALCYVCSLSEGGGTGKIMHHPFSKYFQKSIKFDFRHIKIFSEMVRLRFDRYIFFDINKMDNIIHYMKEALPISRIWILSISRAMRLSCNRTSDYILFGLVVRTVPIITFALCHLFIYYTHFCLLSSLGGIESVTNYL